MARRLAALAVVALLLTAGCQAPTSPGASTQVATDAPTTTPSPTGESTTDTQDDADDAFVATDADLAVDAERVYHRVGRLLDVPRDQRPDVRLRVEEPPEGGGPGASESTGFTQVMGIEPESAGGDGEGSSGVQTGAIARGTVVTLYNHEELNATSTETILAHEFVHVYQTLADVESPLVNLGSGRNLRLLYGAVVEGGATYVEDAYAAQYQNATVDRSGFSAAWRNASAYVRWTLAPYEYGARYYERRVDGPANVTTVYADPPRTTEQVIHGDSPSEEPVADLRVSAETAAPYAWTDATTKGELFARIALSTELDWERAASAADGWGADRLLTFDAGNETGYAWVLRWDDSTEAAEFEGAFADYADNRSAPFDAASVGDDTVVVFAGADSFVASAGASGGDGEVTVTA